MGQHEFACTHPGDPHVSVLGSEDATTCHVVTMRNAATGATAMAHIDTAQGVKEGIRYCIKMII